MSTKDMLIVDRIVGDFAVCERFDRSMMDIPLKELPLQLKEGDCLEKDTSGRYKVNILQTQTRRNANRL